MKRLIADIYKILYKLTHEKALSLSIAIVYITILNIITIQGLAMLIEDWMRMARFLHVLFIFPYYLVTFFILLTVNFLIMLPLKNLKKEKAKKPVILPIVIYSLISIVLFLYIHYSDRF